MIPEALLKSLEGVEGFDKKSFIDVHQSGEPVTSIRVNPARNLESNPQPQTGAAADELPLVPVPWSQHGYYLPRRPSFTFDPLFHAGCYYVQEASSMFLEQAIKQTVDLSQPLKVLDLCAAPGGKSTHLQSLLSADSLLVSNELIKARAGILKQNIVKWGCNNVIVTANDPQHFQKLAGFFDAIVVDAPCSGSGLFRKDENAISEWSPENVQLCLGRQQRILTDVLPSLKENGVLIYSTCSYSKEENEDIADWLAGHMNMESLPLTTGREWGIIETESDRSKALGYRFYPDKIRGEGFFLAAFRKKGSAHFKQYKPGKPNLVSSREKEALVPWFQQHDDLHFLKHETFVFALPRVLLPDFLLVQWALYIQYTGTSCGELIRDKLIPDHALALSPILHHGREGVALTYDEAITYLQRGDLQLNTTEKGWQTVHYQNHSLGWINALPNRVNNYYPKELRILKRLNDSPFEK
jgi:16S rRNA C967 or C1407 C5-methylase (RsmB/RsmF family)/NOL1/NOP2/fmu family ribosome biogenesis protein